MDSIKYNMKDFFIAVENNDLSRVLEMINGGVDISKPDKYGYSALQIASYKGYEEMANVLVDNGIDLHWQDKNGQSILHYVALNNQVNLAKKLLDKGADLSIEDIHGNQPLWTAVFNDKGKNDRIEIIKLFLDFNSDINHKNKVGKSPAEIVKIAHYNNLKSLFSIG